MATLAVTHPTLLDVTKRLDPNGNIDAIAEILNEEKPVIRDMVMKEGNLPTGHMTTIRTGLPTPTWRKLYGGVQPTKGQTAQVTDTCGMLEAYAEVDMALADLNGNTAAFRLSESRAHIEGMAQELEDTIFTGDESTEPEAFTGLNARYNSTSAANGSNYLVDAGSPDESIWLVVWGDDTIFGIYPKGSKAGLQMTDKGQVTVENASEYVGSGSHQGGRYEAYRTHFRWDMGLCVRDWRYAVRIHIDADTTLGTAASGAQLHDFALRAMMLIPNLGRGRARFYASRTMITRLHQQSIAKVASSTLTMQQLAGEYLKTTHLNGIPVQQCDALATGAW